MFVKIQRWTNLSWILIRSKTLVVPAAARLKVLSHGNAESRQTEKIRDYHIWRELSVDGQPQQEAGRGKLLSWTDFGFVAYRNSYKCGNRYQYADDMKSYYYQIGSILRWYFGVTELGSHCRTLHKKTSLCSDRRARPHGEGGHWTWVAGTSLSLSLSLSLPLFLYFSRCDNRTTET